MIFSKKYFVISLVALLFILVVIFLDTFFLRTQTHKIFVAGRERSYNVHLPKGFDESRRYPLLIAMHALSDSPKLLEINTGWSSKADKEGFIVVYPEGTRGKDDTRLSWNAGYCCGEAFITHSGDEAFLVSILGEIKKNYSIDERKVFMTGFSNGGMMTYLFGADFSRQLTAIGVVSASIGGQTKDFIPFNQIPNPQNPLSVIILNGEKDEIVPFPGGKNKQSFSPNKKNDESFISAADSVQFWVNANGCQSSEKESNEKVVKTIYSQCKDNTRVIFYDVKSGTHVWFGGLQEFPNKLLGRSISATDLIWDFFATTTAH